MIRQTTKIDHIHDITANYGVVEQIAPNVRRILCNNPGPFTYTGTATYLIGSGDSVAAIDPGPENDDHLQALLSALEGEKLTHILITHHHRDHSPLAKKLAAATGAVIHGLHFDKDDDDGESVEEGLDPDYQPEELLQDGDIVEGDGWSLQAVHTPGHTANHLCFRLIDGDILFVGDHIMAWSTTIVSPPDGNMRQYMASLEKLIAANDQLYLPTHGAKIEDPTSYVQKLLLHRQEREGQILDALADAPADIITLVDRIYTDIKPMLKPAAARSALAHAIKLVEDGKITANQEKFSVMTEFRLA